MADLVRGRAGRALARVGPRLLGVLLVLVTAVAVLAPLNSWFVFDRPWVLASLALTTVVALLAARTGSLPGSTWSRRRPLLATVSGSVVGLLLVAVATASSVTVYGWDAGAVTQGADDLRAGRGTSPGRMEYFARYPNNLPLLALELTAARAGGVVGIPTGGSATTAQVLMVGVILAALGWTAHLLGRPGLILPVQGAVLLLLGLTPHVAVPYTDLPAATAVALVVLCSAGAVRAGAAGATRAALGWWAGAAVAAGAGLLFKPYVAVLLVAALLVAVVAAAVSGSWRRAWRPLATWALGSAVALGTLAGGGWAAERMTGLTTPVLEAVRTPFPPEMWLASGTLDVGGEEPTRRWGGYDQATVDATGALTDTGEQRAMLRERVAAQVGSRSLGENARFFAGKVAWVWGDATFWAAGKGLDNQRETPHTGGPLRTLSEWTVATGEHYPLRAALVQGAWLGMLLLLAIGLLRAPPGTLTALWSLTLLGVSAYLLLFEARPRYLLAFLPVVLALLVAVAPRGRARPGAADAERAEDPAAVAAGR